MRKVARAGTASDSKSNPCNQNHPLQSQRSALLRVLNETRRKSERSAGLEPKGGDPLSQTPSLDFSHMYNNHATLARNVLVTARPAGSSQSGKFNLQDCDRNVETER